MDSKDELKIDSVINFKSQNKTVEKPRVEWKDQRF